MTGTVQRPCGGAPTSPGTGCTPGARRRRGAALEDAILSAAYDELAEVGYTALTVEAVAARARTGKASIYRRWPTKQDLVLEALCAALPTPAECGLDPDFDDSVTTAEALHRAASVISAILASPAGDAMRAVTCEGLANPELARAVDERFQAPRRAVLLGLLRRGAARGEVRPDAVTDRIADVLPAVLAHRVILMRESVDDAELHAIVDEVLLPLVRAR